MQRRMFTSWKTTSQFLAAVSISGNGNTASFAAIVSLATNETIDIAVGRGDDGSYYYDTTGVVATVTEIPEPATAALMIFGLLSASIIRRGKSV